MIEFPCPEPLENMSPNAIGAHCHSCNKNLTDITSYSKAEKEKFYKANPNACVIDVEDENDTNWFSTRKFALALLIAGSTALFSFSEPMMGTELDNLREALITEPTDNSIALIIIIKNQQGHNIDGEVSVELPNGKTLIAEYQPKSKQYRINLPAYCKGKSIKVRIKSGKKTQNKNITIDAQTDNVIHCKFRTKKMQHVKRGKIVKQGRFL